MAVRFDRSASQILSELVTQTVEAVSPARRSRSPQVQDGREHGGRDDEELGGPRAKQARLHRRSFLGVDSIKGESYFQRLSSFFDGNLWLLKPLEASPCRCAARGWFCTERDLLQCVECKNYLSGHLPTSCNRSLYMKCLNRLKHHLVSGHQSDCSFRTTPTDEIQFAPNFVELQHVEAHLKIRLNSLRDHAVNELSLNSPISAEIAEKLKKSSIFETADRDERKLALALTGWMGGDGRNLLKCQQCCRNVAIWLFCGGEKQLNPVEQHRFWCPWVQKVEVQGIAGVEMLARWRAALDTLLKAESRGESGEKSAKQVVMELFLAKRMMEETVAEAQ